MPDLWTPDHRIIAYVGAQRRMQSACKEHSLPERVLRTEWKATDTIKVQYSKPLERRLRRHFGQQMEAVMQGLDRVRARHWRAASVKAEITPLVVQSLIDWADWLSELAETALPAVSEIFQAGLDAGMSRIGLTEDEATDITSDRAEARQAVQEVVQSISKTQGTTQKQITQAIQRGLEQGETQDQIVQRVRKVGDQLESSRVRTTVRTASNGGFEAGQMESWKQSGIAARRWLSQRDGRVRTPAEGDDWDHRTIDGTAERLEDPYLIQGAAGRTEALRYPGDPRGSAGNIIRCRCGQLPVLEADL